MKTVIFTSIAITFLVAGCGTTSRKSPATQQKVEISDTIETDSVSYELIVMDSRFETYLATLPYSKEFYSESYYKSWIIQYVVEWNMRHNDPIRYGDFYATQIDYDPHVEYGLDLNFRLYHYFLFIEKEYGITLIRRPGK